MNNLEQELKELLVEALMLEDVRPDEIETEAALFGEGLALDSIDGLELAIAIERKYGIKMEASNEETRAAFASIKALAIYVAPKRSQA